MTKMSFNRTSDWVRSQQARELRYTSKDQRTKAPITPEGKKRHTSPDPDRDRVTLKMTQNRLLRKSKVKPSMPRMPWEKET